MDTLIIGVLNVRTGRKNIETLIFNVLNIKTKTNELTASEINGHLIS